MNDEQDSVTKFVSKQMNSIIRRTTGKRTFYDAQNYVSTDAVSGKLQVDILKQAGMSPSSDVLEVGCGCLNAGKILIEELEPNHYVGIEPNTWLVECALRSKAMTELVSTKHPVFLSNLEFDASETERKFDFVLSHSILSHAAHWQLPLFLANVGRMLKPTGKIFASLYLAEGNSYGSPGTPTGQDSRDEEWVYPGISHFTQETLLCEAAKAGLTAILRHDLTELHTKVRPLECHDWYQFVPSGSS